MGMINIKVVGSSGRGVKAKIGGKLSGAFGGMVSGGYTNSDGHGNLEWSSSGYLSTIYIDGKAHNGKFRSGETHVFRK